MSIVRRLRVITASRHDGSRVREAGDRSESKIDAAFHYTVVAQIEEEDGDVTTNFRSDVADGRGGRHAGTRASGQHGASIDHNFEAAAESRAADYGRRAPRADREGAASDERAGAGRDRAR